MSDVRFDNQTVILTGALGALGKGLALFYGARGANVVVNHAGAQNINQLVQQIKSTGGKAIGSAHAAKDGEKIIDAALQSFGKVDVLISHAEADKKAAVNKISQEDLKLVVDDHLEGTAAAMRALWPHFRKQKYGRVVFVVSPAAIFGAGDHSALAAAEASVIGFTKALAKEGKKNNILANVVATKYPSNDVTHATVGLLSASAVKETGSVFNVDGSSVSIVHRQRTVGALLKPDETFTPGAVLAKWGVVRDFTGANHPQGPPDFKSGLQKALGLLPNSQQGKIDFTGRVVVVTGGGAGLGRAYSLYFARLGASVVVSDLSNADRTVQEIVSAGGKAVASTGSVENGDAIIAAAINTWGRVDVLVNNAGIIRDKSFQNMSPKDWNDVVNVHLYGTSSTIRAAWPYMVAQKYGRIVNTTSISGLYGSFGQTNYSAAKSGIIGLTQSLALEGEKNNIIVNAIAPSAGTQMTATVMSKESVDMYKPDYVAPTVALLSSDRAPDTGLVIEVGAAWQAETRWSSTDEARFPAGQATPELLLQKLPKLGSSQAPKPSSRLAPSGGTNKWLQAIEKAKKTTLPGTPFNYTDKDVILYNLSVGATAKQLPFTYERDPDFQVLPTFGVLPYFGAKKPFQFGELVPNFQSMNLLHGEQYLEVRKWPIPISAQTLSSPKLVEVVDKGKSSLVVTGTITRDASTNEELFYNEETVFLRKAGGFEGQKKPCDRGLATAAIQIPSRAADASAEDLTSPDQAALYRLNGDRNPLHIDPKQSSKGGFPTPILHGLASFGFAGRRIVERYGPFRNIKVRFTSVVLPGQTLKTEFWEEQDVVTFRTMVKETGKTAISGRAQLHTIRSKLS
ncbi:peroxisomal hydratase-dehydrogenase-epimerase [Ilyonectria sp. MPI-CAGE-AT-0026]|nr:peroxisomal hydratase-dehydrogenase-epimerase [Ilyonectria sp. MPI-CAGE-AT-0026]